jgi:hypothetical protein
MAQSPSSAMMGIHSRLMLSVFFTPARYRVVKIVCSCSEVVLRTMKHTIVYPGSGPYYVVIVLHPVFFVLKKKNSVTMG